MKYFNKHLTVGLMLFVATIIGFQPGCRKHRPDVNVVLIVIDTLRYDHLHFCGYKKNTAPFLSKIAAESVVFEKAFAASSWTPPSTASIFTSLYPFQHGVITGYIPDRNRKVKLRPIPEELETITEVLKNSGYRTYGVSNNINIGNLEGFAQGFDHFRKFDYYRGNKKEINDQLKKWAPEIKNNGKYFLYLHYNDPHRPYHKRYPWFKRTGTIWGNMVSRYDSEINYVDSMIEEMFRLFQWQRNTIVIVTSDHGEEFWDHGQISHGRTLFSEVVHIPFFIYFPERERRAVRIDGEVTNMDILPTLRAYLGLDRNSDDQGINLLPMISNRLSEKGSRYIFSYLFVEGDEGEPLHLKSVIQGKWKCIFDRNGYKKLYNLEDDPGETRNLYKEKKALFNRLKHKFIEFESNCKKYRPEIVEINMGWEKLLQLKTLGYAQ